MTYFNEQSVGLPRFIEVAEAEEAGVVSCRFRFHSIIFGDCLVHLAYAGAQKWPTTTFGTHS